MSNICKITFSDDFSYYQKKIRNINILYLVNTWYNVINFNISIGGQNYGKTKKG